MRYTDVTPTSDQVDNRPQFLVPRPVFRLVGNFEADATGTTAIQVVNPDQALPAPTAGNHS